MKGSYADLVIFQILRRCAVLELNFWTYVNTMWATRFISPREPHLFSMLFDWVDGILLIVCWKGRHRTNCNNNRLRVAMDSREGGQSEEKCNLSSNQQGSSNVSAHWSQRFSSCFTLLEMLFQVNSEIKAIEAVIIFPQKFRKDTNGSMSQSCEVE